MIAARARAERWIPVAAVLSLVIAGLMDAAVRYYWVDEILTATLVTDPSVVHMVRALADQVDTSPPLYYVIAWCWAHVFGAAAVSLRLLSSLFAAAGFVILWRTLRPYASLSARAAIVCSAMLLPHVLLHQVAEARAYGLLIALAALTLYQLDRLAQADRPSTMMMIGVAAAQAALVLTHTMGLAYSVAALGALIASDLLRGRRRISAYAAWAAGWIAFLLWLPALRHQSQVGLPNFPIPRPTAAHLRDGLTLGAQTGTIVFVALLLFVALGVARRSEPPEEFEAPPADRYLPLALAAASWVAFAFVLWIVSRVSRPLFLPRYLLPLAPAYAVIGTFAFEALLTRARAFARAHLASHRPPPPANSYVWLLATVIAISLYEPVWRADHLPASNIPAGDSLEMRFDMPIATISTHSYLPRVWYAAHPERYVFILDSVDALRPASPVGPTEYKLMSAMGRNYPSHRVEQGDRFLAETPRFLVIDEAGLFWFKARVRDDPRWKVTLLYPNLLCGSGLPEDRCSVYVVDLVERAGRGGAGAGGRAGETAEGRAGHTAERTTKKERD